MSEDKREFETGAFRDVNHNKINFMSYITPIRIARYGAYMKEMEEKYGRANYRKGIPIFELYESAYRHFITLMLKDLDGVDSPEFREWQDMNERLGHYVPEDYDESSALEFFLEAREYSKDRK